MTYSVKEIFYTLQGEGAQTGRPAVFLRFAGCNLWSGKEQDRNRAICNFCDTDFVGNDGPGGGKFSTEQDLANEVLSLWPSRENDHKRFVVCTGGEPLLQLDKKLIDALHILKFEIAIETNGTILAPDKIDWICVSPKSNASIIQKTGNELKLVFPQLNEKAQPEEFTNLKFKHFFLQPLESKDLKRNTKLAIEYCLSHPQWKLSIQTHKTIGIS